ncbi:restriction endonuclease subunit S [Vibrio lentus]|uniref:restriction endonuclease subunit S n=1 Tax=Vibrio lentus TaxID=136468 RepID=UPI000C8384E2|nr:restriction endonuclease subunit S [Vibrio lentus]PMI96014.1 type I restriction endonuclease subunit S [Vibrio lentus]
MSVEQTSMNQLITDNIDVWTSTVKTKSASGRGSSKKRELYGVKKLRELILELAVRGKLVPQDPTDEPASVLLERIAEEKAQLVKDKIISRTKALPALLDEDIPNDLPKGWSMVRLGNLTSKLGSGSTPRGGKNVYTTEGIPFLRSQNVRNEGIKLDDIAYIPVEVHQKMDKTKVIPSDVLLNITGASLGRSTVFPESLVEANVSQHVTIIRLIERQMSQFVHLGILSPMVQRLVWGRQVGMAIEGLSKKVLEMFEFPVPPLKEQHRIVTKVDELMTLCDQLEQQTEVSITAHQVLVTTLLDTLTNSADADELMQNWARISEHFDTLFTTEASIDQLKQTILQLAVMGKLVPQDPNDEPAAKLLESIAEEKAQLIKDKIYQKTSKLKPKNELISYPEGWVGVQTGQVCPSIVPNRDRPKSFTGEIPWVTLPAFPQQSLYLDSTKVELALTEAEVKKYSARLIPAGSVLMSCVGRFGLTAINTVPVTSNQQVHGFIILKGLLPEYLSMVIRVEGQVLESVATSTTIAYLNKTNCESIQFGLPPENEQRLIVEKSKELIELCEQLKARLNDSQTTKLHLTDAIVEQAV